MSWRRLLSALGLGRAAMPARPPYAPYRNPAFDSIYNLLFCDDRAALLPRAGEPPTSWQATLGADPIDAGALLALANDAAAEGRIRYRAFAALRAARQPVEPKILLGVIVEMPVAGGLDTLAAYSEGGVRYINHAPRLLVLEGVEAVKAPVERLFAATRPLVAQLGPWEAERRPPPAPGHARLSFLVSDGLYFGEGPAAVLMREAQPVMTRATELLQAAIACGSTPDATGARPGS